MGGQGNQGPGWHSLLQQKTSSTLFNTKQGFQQESQRDCFPFRMSICLGARARLVLPVPDPAQGRGKPCVAFLFDVLSAQLTCLCSWIAAVYLELMTFEHAEPNFLCKVQ